MKATSLIITKDYNHNRKYYVDNIRWACILFLIPFHVAMAWNCWGEGNYIWFAKNKIFSSIITFVSPWYMSLLFVLAGMSTFYSLQKRSYRQYIKERFMKLLLPLIAGLLTVVPLMTYYADKFHSGYEGNFFEHYQVYFTKFTELTGYDGGWTPAHLWFLLYLFIISLIGIGIVYFQKRRLPKFSRDHFLSLKKELSKKQEIAFLYALGLLPIAFSPVINIAGKSIGSYLVFFLLGFYIFSKDDMIACVVKNRWINLGFLIIADVLDVYMFIWADNANSIVNLIAMYFTCWFGILTVLGFSRLHFNQHNKVTRYLTSRSFVFYIFHYIWVILLQFYISDYTSKTVLLFLIPVVGAYIMTFLTIEIVVRMPILNVLFGIKKKEIKK